MPGIPQLVAERMDGKRPGYRGEGEYQGGRSSTSSGGGNIVDEVALTAIKTLFSSLFNVFMCFLTFFPETIIASDR